MSYGVNKKMFGRTDGHTDARTALPGPYRRTPGDKVFHICATYNVKKFTSIWVALGGGGGGIAGTKMSANADLITVETYVQGIPFVYIWAKL